jgi:lysophospholipase L1-like esterase
VSLDAYKNNIISVIEQSEDRTIFLISTIPNLDTSRNIEIMRYNELLSTLAEQYTHVHYVEVYNDFSNHPDYYLDNTHMNETGYEIITQKILSAYNKLEISSRNIL